VALQVALTCVLLVVSGLFLRTLQSLENVKLGFDPKGVTTLVLVPENQDAEPERARQMEIALLHRFEAMPGVQSVTMQSEIPFSPYNMTMNGTTEIAGRAHRPGDHALYSLVSTNFVHTSGIRLLQGRSFAASDENSAAMVALVNEAFVRKYLNERDALGTVLHFHREKGEADADLPFTQAITVVGVVENEVQGGDLGAAHDAMVYLDNLQLPASSFLTHIFTMAAQYAIRSPLSPASLAAELRAVVHRDAATMVEMSLQPMEVSIEQSLGQRKLALRLVASFAGAALVLSAVGIYGVLAYAVARRRREIGIRMALGSARPDAAKLVMRQAGAMVLLGLIPGIGGAWAAAYIVRGFLYGVQPLDGITLLAVGGVLLLVAGCAASIPALRAASVDPLEALRAE
jgi:predicted permease